MGHSRCEGKLLLGQLSRADAKGFEQQTGKSFEGQSEGTSADYGARPAIRDLQGRGRCL